MLYEPDTRRSPACIPIAIVFLVCVVSCKEPEPIPIEVESPVLEIKIFSSMVHLELEKQLQSKLLLSH